MYLLEHSLLQRASHRNIEEEMTEAVNWSGILPSSNPGHVGLYNDIGTELLDTTV